MSPHYLRKLSILLISAFSLFFIWATHSVYRSNNLHIYAENGLIENLQAIGLACASLLYLIAAFQKRQATGPILIFFSLLCYAFFLRELDVEKMNIPQVFQIIGSGTGRNITILVALIALIAYVSLNNFSLYKESAYRYIRTKSGQLIMIAGMALLISSLFEKQLTFANHVYFEEMLELLGYLLLLLSSIISLSNKSLQ